MQHEGSKKPVSTTAKGSVTLKGKAITIDYSAPSARGRKIFGETSAVRQGVAYRR